MSRRWLIVIIVLGLPGCSDDAATPERPDVIHLQAWAHAGQAAERRVIQAQVARFNERTPDVDIKLTLIPERSYNAQVQAAAIAGDLPELLELDGPYLYNYAWQGHLQPLDGLLPGDLSNDLLPSIIAQGRYRGRIYGIGVFDSGLGLYASRRALSRAGARIPGGPADAWTAQEFTALLQALAAHDADGAVLDLKLNYPGEWFTYAFSPILQSAGADLIDRNGYQSADGVLNAPAAVKAMTTLQAWLRGGFVDANVDDGAFVTSRVALSWAGHWEYARYAGALGDDLLLLPLPDFGHGTRTGQGSWVWGMTATGKRAEAAARFLRFLLEPGEVLAMADANGAVPARQAAIANSERYGDGGPLRLFVEQLTEGYAVPRPQTPAYPVITAAFQQAFFDIRDGAEVRAALDRAVAAIDQDIADNKGYR
ncbi:MAG TPA: extracellular solute-binding protein [Anaerolineae bacterium]|nr:extracellular solute-binding protein [Anaerolineae bacterium]